MSSEEDTKRESIVDKLDDIFAAIKKEAAISAARWKAVEANMMAMRNEYRNLADRVAALEASHHITTARIGAMEEEE